MYSKIRPGTFFGFAGNAEDDAEEQMQTVPEQHDQVEPTAKIPAGSVLKFTYGAILGSPAGDIDFDLSKNCDRNEGNKFVDGQLLVRLTKDCAVGYTSSGRLVVASGVDSTDAYGESVGTPLARVVNDRCGTLGVVKNKGRVIVFEGALVDYASVPAGVTMLPTQLVTVTPVDPDDPDEGEGQESGGDLVIPDENDGTDPVETTPPADVDLAAEKWYMKPSTWAIAGGVLVVGYLLTRGSSKPVNGLGYYYANEKVDGVVRKIPLMWKGSDGRWTTRIVDDYGFDPMATKTYNRTTVASKVSRDYKGAPRRFVWADTGKPVTNPELQRMSSLMSGRDGLGGVKRTSKDRLLDETMASTRAAMRDAEAEVRAAHDRLTAADRAAALAWNVYTALRTPQALADYNLAAARHNAALTAVRDAVVPWSGSRKAKS